MRHNWIILFGAAVFTGASVAKAGLTLQLSSPADLGTLVPGQTVRIDVGLSELSDRQLELLTTGVAFDDSILGPGGGSGNVSAGPIVPNAGDPMSFSPSTDPGFVDVIFEAIGDSSTDRITENGRFFSFELTALEPGSGEILFDFADALQFNGNGVPLQPEIELGPGLEVTVVPLPTGLALGLLGLGGVISGRLIRRQRQATSGASLP